MINIIGAADIGGMTIKLGFFDETLRLLRSWSIPTDLSDNGANILPKLCESLKAELKLIEAESFHRTYQDGANNKNDEVLQADTSWLDMADYPESRDSANDDAAESGYKYKSETINLAGIGIAVPAAVDEQSVARSCTNIGWGTVNLREVVSKLMPDVKVLKFGNDANAAALGELKLGAARKHRSAYLITLGTGVGGGYAENGRVISGAHGAAGEIGHIIINPHETSKCMCGRYGCLEQYASAAGIVRLAKNILYLISDSKYNDYNSLHIERLFNLKIPRAYSKLEVMEHFDAKYICDAARSGDKLSQYILDVFGECMGLAMSSISCTIDPECFIIGGGMSKGGDIVLDTIRKGFAKYAYPATAATPIIQAELGNNAGIYGCAVMVSTARHNG